MEARIVARAPPSFVYVVYARLVQWWWWWGVTCAHLPHARRFTHTVDERKKKNKFAYTNYGCVEQSRCVECAFPSEA